MKKIFDYIQQTHLTTLRGRSAVVSLVYDTLEEEGLILPVGELIATSFYGTRIKSWTKVLRHKDAIVVYRISEKQE